MALRASFTLVAALYVRPADAAALRGLALRQCLAAADGVAQADDLRLARVEHFIDAAPQRPADLVRLQMFVHVVVLGQNVDQRQAVAVAVRVEHVREQHFRRVLARAAKIHQDLVFGALAGIRRQPHALVGPVGVDALDESDRADRDQIVRVVIVRVVFFDDVRHQPQVAFNEHVARLQVALQPGVEIFALLGLAQRAREGAAGRQAQHQKCTAHHQHQGTVQHFQPSVSA